MKRHIYSLEEEKFLIDNVKGITLKQLTEIFNKQFNLSLSESSIANRKNKLGLSSGISGGQFQKGHNTWNKGIKGYMGANKTSFKKGNIPHNHRTVGSERISKNGYIEIKVAEPNKWELKHRYIYEKEHGKIPEGYNVMFADKNKLNLDIDNLILVSKSEDLIMNQNKLIFKDQELTKTGHLIAKVISKTNNLKKGDVSNGKV